VAHLAGQGTQRNLLVGADGKTLLLHDTKSGLLERFTIGDETLTKVATIAPDVCHWQQSRDGRRLLVVHPSPVCSLEVIEIPSGRRSFQFRSATSLIPHDAAKRASLSPDGHWLAFIDGLYLAPPHSQVLLFDVDSGKAAPALPHQENVISPVWHPDNRTLAVGGIHSDDVYLWDAPSTKLINTLRDQKGGEPTLAMSASGQLLTSVSDWSGSQVFWHPHLGRVLLRTPLRYALKSMVQDGRQFEYSIDKPRITLRVAEPSPVFRILVPDPAGPPRDHARLVSLHPRARILAFGHRFGVSLFDLGSGLLLGQVDLGPTPHVGYDTARFDPSNGDLLTYGPLGLYRWPVQIKSSVKETVIVGPERLLGNWARGFGFDTSRDGGLIAIADASTATVLNTSGGAQTQLRPLIDCRDVQVSPDGRWVFASSFGTTNGTMWDSQTGQEVAKIDGASGLFSPDGNWLWSSHTRYRVGTWEKGPPLPVAEGPGPIAFSPDGTIFVGAVGDKSVALVDAVTGKTLVQLSPPFQSRCENAAFSPDGSQLVLQDVDMVSVFVWDLRVLRRHLAELGLDWDAPPLSLGPDEERAPAPLLTVETSQMIERALDSQIASRQYSAAAASLKKLVQSKPDEHMPWFQLALVSVFLDDRETLTEVIPQIERRFAATTDPFIRERFLKAFVLAQVTLPDTTIPEAWVQSVRADPAPPGLEPWNPLAAALVELQQNQPSEAVAHLQRALAVNHDLFIRWRIPYAIGSLTASCRFAESLALSAQGVRQAAHDAYTQGLSVYWTQMPHLPTDPMYPTSFWQEYLVSCILCRRAEERLFGREQTEIDRYRMLAQAQARQSGGPPIRHPNEVLKPTDVVASWALYVAPDAKMNVYPAAGAIVFQVDTGGAADSQVQAFQHGLDLKEGGEYVIRFKARAGVPRSVMVRAGIDHDDFHSIGLDERIPLSEQFDSFEFKFRAHDVAPNHNRFGFMLGGEDGAVFVKDMSLVETAFDAAVLDSSLEPRE
jgi:WD40 repeat protein